MEIRVVETYIRDGTRGWKIENKGFTEDEWVKLVMAANGVGRGRNDERVEVKEGNILFYEEFGDMDEETVKRLVREMIDRIRRMDNPKELIFVI